MLQIFVLRRPLALGYVALRLTLWLCSGGRDVSLAAGLPNLAIYNFFITSAAIKLTQPLSKKRSKLGTLKASTLKPATSMKAPKATKQTKGTLKKVKEPKKRMSFLNSKRKKDATKTPKKSEGLPVTTTAKYSKSLPSSKKRAGPTAKMKSLKSYLKKKGRATITKVKKTATKAKRLLKRKVLRKKDPAVRTVSSTLNEKLNIK